MSTFTNKLSAGLVALVLGTAAAVAAGPAMAKGGGGHGGGHGGGWGHGHGWGHGYGWGYGIGGYAPAYVSNCYPKRYVGEDGEVIVRQVCS